MAVCAFRDMSNRSPRMRQMWMTTLLCVSATTTAAQEYRVRTNAVLWFGGRVDWVLGGLVRVGYRF